MELHVQRPAPSWACSGRVVRAPHKLPPSLPTLTRTTVKGLSGAYKPWIVEEARTKTVLVAYRAMPSKALAFQRSADSGYCEFRLKWSLLVPFSIEKSGHFNRNSQ